MTTTADKKNTGNAAPKRAVVRHLNATQKAQAIELWRSGQVTLNDLAAKFKKDRRTFVRLFKEQGVEKGEAVKEINAAVQEKVKEDMVNDATVLANRIRETKEEHYKMSAGIAKLVWFTISKARQEGKSVASVGYDLKALKVAAETLRITREDRYAVLGISEDDDAEDKPLPDLVVQELTAEDIIQIQKQKLMEAADGLDVGEIVDDTLGDEQLFDGENADDDEDDRVELE